MKPIRLLTLASLAVIVLSSTNTYAQPNDASATSSTSRPSQSAKSSKAANRQLAKAVSHALGRTKGLDTSNVTVRAKSGAVTLEGAVPEAAQIDKAAQVATGVSGVTSVKNALTVRPVGQ